MSRLNVNEFTDTPALRVANEVGVIQKLKQKSKVKPENEPVSEEPEVEVKSTRGRKRKYKTAEERIQARRAQQKAYRERKKKEFEELKAKAMKSE